MWAAALPVVLELHAAWNSFLIKQMRWSICCCEMSWSLTRYFVKEKRQLHRGSIQGFLI